MTDPFARALLRIKLAEIDAAAAEQAWNGRSMTNVSPGYSSRLHNDMREAHIRLSAAVEQARTLMREFGE